jgi:hypothetical protein
MADVRPLAAKFGMPVYDLQIALNADMPRTRTERFKDVEGFMMRLFTASMLDSNAQTKLSKAWSRWQRWKNSDLAAKMYLQASSKAKRANAKRAASFRNYLNNSNAIHARTDASLQRLGALGRVFVAPIIRYQKKQRLQKAWAEHDQRSSNITKRARERPRPDLPLQTLVKHLASHLPTRDIASLGLASTQTRNALVYAQRGREADLRQLARRLRPVLQSATLNALEKGLGIPVPLRSSPNNANSNGSARFPITSKHFYADVRIGYRGSRILDSHIVLTRLDGLGGQVHLHRVGSETHTVSIIDNPDAVQNSIPRSRSRHWPASWIHIITNPE